MYMLMNREIIIDTCVHMVWYTSIYLSPTSAHWKGIEVATPHKVMNTLNTQIFVSNINHFRWGRDQGTE